MPPARLRLSVGDGVAAAVLAGPDSGHAIDEVMAAEIREAFADLDDRPDVAAVVLAGQGGRFCRGTAITGRARPGAIEAHRAASAIAACGKPTIAAIEGDALDQGLEIALACDIRIASASARLGLTQVASGSLPWDGGTQRLPRLIGRSRALHMLLLARVVGAEEAAGIGLVAEVAGPGGAMRRASEAAAVIASHGPLALRYLKEAVHKGSDLALDPAMRMEFDLATLLHSTRDRDEGLRAFAERRRPEFTGE